MFSFPGESLFAECVSEASTREISPALPPCVLARSYPTEVPDHILLRLRSRGTQEKKIKGLCTEFSSAACYNLMWNKRTNTAYLLGSYVLHSTIRIT